MDELYDRGVSSDDGHDSAADVISEADHPTQSVNDNGHENWAEDAEPLTRGEYADQIRTADRDTDRDDAKEPVVAEDSKEPEELPEPRTRQEVAEEADRADPAIPDHDQTADVDLNASIAEEDNLPEPRARQEVAEEARSGRDPLAHADSDVQQDGRDADDSPSPEERAQLHETYLDWRKEISAGREQGTNVVGDKPDRSPDDRRDLPPTGEELLDMDSDKLSRFGALREETYREIDDILDSSEKYGGAIKDLFDRPPMESHSETPAGHPAIEQQSHEGIDGGHLVVAAMVLGIVGFEAVRRIKDRMKVWKGADHGGNR